MKKIKMLKDIIGNKTTQKYVKATNSIKKMAYKIKNRWQAVESGEVYVDTGVKILIAVIIGAVLLVALIALFKTTIMPTVSQKVTDMFSQTPSITP